jgi:predicted nucleic acid-binding protein
MKKLFIDTNIVLDLLAKREPFYESSAKLFSLADGNEIQLSVSSLTFANTNYVLSKLKSANEAKEILRKFKLLIQIVSLSEKIVDLALNDTAFKDFEDGLQYYSAIESNQDVIITRNQKDFKSSLLSVMSAQEFLSSLS